MKAHIAILGLALLCFPILLEAQASARAEGSASLQLEGRQSGDAERSAAGSAALAATAAAGLPQLHVRRAINEGQAKGASPGQIERAAAEAHTRLVVAGELLSQRSGSARAASEAELTAAAEAMAAGASRADLQRVRDAAPADRNLAVSLEALAHLRASGVAGGEASRQIAAGLRGGASDRQITGLIEGSGGLRTRRGAGAGSLHTGGAVGSGISGAAGSVRGAARVTGSLGGSVF